jgi:hypothetical protein
MIRSDDINDWPCCSVIWGSNLNVEDGKENCEENFQDEEDGIDNCIRVVHMFSGNGIRAIQLWISLRCVALQIGNSE